jgi:hypothetical protein
MSLNGIASANYVFRKVIGRSSTVLDAERNSPREMGTLNPFSESVDKKWFPLIMKYERGGGERKSVASHT